MPALLATAAVHHHLVRQGLRMQTGLVVETGEAREVHHFCVLAGYGAEAINPYLAFETLEDPREAGTAADRQGKVQKNYIKAVGKGILKVMSKMGISTYQSYCGAQIFDAVGLSSAFVEKYFTGTATTIEGVGLAEVAEEAVRRHATGLWRQPDLQRRCSMSAGSTNTPARRGTRLDAAERRQVAARGARQHSRRTTRNSPQSINEQSNGC
jgi:glutamate synthase (NADPH) large chain